MFPRISKYVGRRYHRLRNLWPVWFYVLNRKSRRSWREYARVHPLDTNELAIVASLERDGIAFSHVHDLLPEDVLFSELLQHAHKLLGCWNTDQSFRECLEAQKESAKKGAKKEFLIPLYGGGWTTPEFLVSDPVIRFALKERLVRIVAAYLHMFPKFSTFSLMSTVVVPLNARAELSQRWHRDPEDKKMLKIFLYLSDVLDEGAGPFTYVRESTYGHRFGPLFPQQPPNGSYPPDGAVEQNVPHEAIHVCTGRKGTIIFADTSGLHRGGYSTTVERLMLTAGFCSPASAFQKTFTIPSSERTHFSTLSIPAQRVLECL